MEPIVSPLMEFQQYPLATPGIITPSLSVSNKSLPRKSWFMFATSEYIGILWGHRKPLHFKSIVAILLAAIMQAKK
jgi:hypothetical protein